MSMELRFAPLFSGSSGNATYVGCGETHLLVDAGLSGTRIIAELRKLGIGPGQLSAILVTHEHNDHCSGVGILARKYHIPVYATAGSWVGMEGKVGRIDGKLRCEMFAGQDFYLGALDIMPFPIPHDAQEPVGLCFEHGGVRFAIATDIGCPQRRWMDAVRGSDAVLLEANYDPDMLQAGSYPYRLKQRILSATGHLCNDDAGSCALELVKAGAKQIVLGHLSKENNFPELARRCAENALAAGGVRAGEDMRLDVARRDAVTGVFAVRREE